MESVPIYIMGKRFEVPGNLTIQKAMEHAGYQLVRGCGCRGGICGACATVYRKPKSHRVEIGLACQTVVEPDMHLTQIPFFPANRAEYRLEDLEANGSTVADLYPEVFKCVGCNTCTRGCPMDIDVMGVMSLAIRGDIQGAAEKSFDCVMCGICAARCPAETVQYNVSILTRRLYGRYIAPPADHLAEQVRAIEEGQFDDAMREIVQMNEDELRDLYRERPMEPETAPEDWTPTEMD
jgi:ferredoxin